MTFFLKDVRWPDDWPEIKCRILSGVTVPKFRVGENVSIVIKENAEFPAFEREGKVHGVCLSYNSGSGYRYIIDLDNGRGIAVEEADLQPKNSS